MQIFYLYFSGFPPRSASVCSDQSTTSKLSGHSTMSLDRKSKKRKEKNLSPSDKKTDVTSAKIGVNKLSGVRCQLNGSVPVPQHMPVNHQSNFHTSNNLNTHNSPSINNSVNLHSGVIARKPPTPTRQTIDTPQYENELKQSSQSELGFSATKPPRPYKSDSLQNGQNTLMAEHGSADSRQTEKVVVVVVVVDFLRFVHWYYL